MQRTTDAESLDEAIIDAEAEDQCDLGDEEDAEEESEPAQTFLAAALEGMVRDDKEPAAEREENGAIRTPPINGSTPSAGPAHRRRTSRG